MAKPPPGSLLRQTPEGRLAAVRRVPAAAGLVRALATILTPVHLVGGAVRDLALGRVPTELDLLTEVDPAELARALGGAVRVHPRFGTATVELGAQRYDIARARTETYPRPGALPVVVPATIEADLPRRDFTINAIALTLSGPTAGELHAVPQAFDDLAAGVLRVIHAQSFAEDPTRLLRMARYAARLQFTAEPVTAGLADAAIASGALRTISGERVGHELRLLATESDPVAALKALRPGITDRFDAALAHAALSILGDSGRRDLLVLGLAVRDADELGFPAGEAMTIRSVATDAQSVRLRLRAAGRPAEIHAAVRGVPPETVAVAGALGAEGPAREWLERLRHVALAITGDDLLAAGIVPGPAVGRGLRAALAATLDGEASSPEDQLAVALRAAQGS